MKRALSRAGLFAVLLLLAPLAFDSGIANAQTGWKGMGGQGGPAVSGGPKSFSPGGPRAGKSNAGPKVFGTPKVVGKPKAYGGPKVLGKPKVLGTPKVLGKKKPPIIVKPGKPKHKHAHRRWKPGLKWRWIIVPSIIIAEDLDWCHYHRYRVPGMHFHRSVRCHRHSRWDHPAIRYVEGY